MLLSPAMELNRSESTTAVKIWVCGYSLPVPAAIPNPTLGRTTTGNGYTRGSGRKFDLRVRVGSGNNLLAAAGSGRVVKTVYPQTPSGVGYWTTVSVLRAKKS